MFKINILRSFQVVLVISNSCLGHSCHSTIMDYSNLNKVDYTRKSQKALMDEHEAFNLSTTHYDIIALQDSNFQ